MYTMTNYRTKKALIEDFKAGKKIACFQPGPFPGKMTGGTCLEGPHYPEPHRWYAAATLENGVIVAMKGVKVAKPDATPMLEGQR